MARKIGSIGDVNPIGSKFPVPSGFGHWLAGLTDGEGTFTIHQDRRRRGGRKHDSYALRFQIRLRDDDREVLVLCQQTLGIGHLTPCRARATSRPTLAWSVTSLPDCERLVEVFDTCPLRSKKARDYAVWKRAVKFLGRSPRGNRWHGPRDWTPVATLKVQLETVRLYEEHAHAA